MTIKNPKEKKEPVKYPNNQVIKSALRPNFCLDVVAGGMNSGNAVHMWDCTGTDNQIWNLDENNRIVNKRSGKCLNATDRNNNAQINQFDCHRGDNQQWGINENGQLVVKQSGKCLTIEGNHIQNGAGRIVIDDCATGTNQIWL